MGKFILVFLVFVAIVSTISVFLLKKTKPTCSRFEIVVGVFYIFSLILFGLNSHTEPYHEAIDPVKIECYSPFGESHLFSLLTFFALYLFSKILIWKKGLSLPPLSLVVLYVLYTIGSIINVFILLQISLHNTASLGATDGNIGTSFIFAPIIGLIIYCILTINLVVKKSVELNDYKYRNKTLNVLNQFLSKRSRQPIWIVILLLPVFTIIILLLILFGQDPDAMVKVFTDTTTWRFSQQIHPPILDEHGHYLCTVAAKGNPKLVKPIHIGTRNGRPIIVNRQLKIANAFEEMIQVSSPKLHKKIRGFYDKYGYNLSHIITNERLSNITYIMMKPLEYFFLLCLYLFWQKPEELISIQYK